MYVTRRRSELLKNRGLLDEQPDGPNSGFLVIQDDESDEYTCSYNRTLWQLPFPQNELLITYPGGSSQTVYGAPNDDPSWEKPVFFIPVLNKPLSFYQYYAINPQGVHKGEAFTCSTEDDKATFCIFRCIKDVKPRPLDPNNIYQQFQIIPAFGAQYHDMSKCWNVSETQNCFPPKFLRRCHWSIHARTLHNLKLDDAHGLDSKLRARLPDFDGVSISLESSQPCIVGKWYCPFMFVKDGTLRDQVERSLYYKMTLEQRWEPIFTYRKTSDNDAENSVAIDALVEKEEVFIGDMKALWSEKNVVDEVIWFGTVENPQRGLGLRVEIMERMKWEQARGGWEGGDKRQVKIDRIEEFKGDGKWCAFGCYILVERFNLRRMDGSLVMSYDFKHCNQIKTKWVQCQCCVRK